MSCLSKGGGLANRGVDCWLKKKNFFPLGLPGESEGGFIMVRFF